jgi:hypothetical protein
MTTNPIRREKDEESSSEKEKSNQKEVNKPKTRREDRE